MPIHMHIHKHSHECKRRGKVAGRLAVGPQNHVYVLCNSLEKYHAKILLEPNYIILLPFVY